MNTYHVNINNPYLPAMPDLSLLTGNQQLAGSPYLKGHTAVLAIFNNVGSARKVTLNNFNVTDLTNGNAGLNITGGANGPTQYTLDIVLISGYTSGTTSPIYKFDYTSGTTLPSEIVSYKSPSSVASFSTSKIRRMPTDTSICAGVVLSACVMYNSRIMGAKYQGLNTSGGFNNYGDSGQTSQNLVLREGQGIALVPSTFATVTTVIYHYTIQFRVNNQFYVINDTVSIGAQPAFCLFNNTGSGVVLQVIDVDIYEGGFTSDPTIINTENFLNYFTVEPIFSIKPSQLDINSGTTITAISYDSSSESLSGLVDIRTNCPVNITDDKGGEIIIQNYYRKTPQVTFSNGADSGALLMNFKNSGKDQMNGIVLNEGQGIAIIKRGVGGYGHSNIDLVFSTTTVQSVNESFSGFV